MKSFTVEPVAHTAFFSFISYIFFFFSFISYIFSFYPLSLFFSIIDPVAVCVVSLKRRRRGKWLKWTESFLLSHFFFSFFSSTSLPSSFLPYFFSSLNCSSSQPSHLLSNLTWWLYASIKACFECEESESVRMKAKKERRRKEQKKWKMWKFFEEDNLLPDCSFKDTSSLTQCILFVLNHLFYFPLKKKLQTGYFHPLSIHTSGMDSWWMREWDWRRRKNCALEKKEELPHLDVGISIAFLLSLSSHLLCCSNWESYVMMFRKKYERNHFQIKVMFHRFAFSHSCVAINGNTLPSSLTLMKLLSYQFLDMFPYFLLSVLSISISLFSLHSQSSRIKRCILPLFLFSISSFNQIKSHITEKKC